MRKRPGGVGLPHERFLFLLSRTGCKGRTGWGGGKVLIPGRIVLFSSSELECGSGGGIRVVGVKGLKTISLLESLAALVAILAYRIAVRRFGPVARPLRPKGPTVGDRRFCASRVENGVRGRLLPRPVMRGYPRTSSGLAGFLREMELSGNQTAFLRRAALKGAADNAGLTTDERRTSRRSSPTNRSFRDRN